MTLPVFQATIVNNNGDIIPNPQITVLTEPLGTPATLFSDRDGTVPLGINGVFSGDTTGFAQFFAEAGNYRVTAFDSGSGFTKTWDFVAMVGDAAFRQVQASPADTTAGALLNNETTHIGGNLNYTGVNYQPETLNGIGVVLKMKNKSGGSISNGATVSGSLLAHYFTDATGVSIEAGATGGSGTIWKNVSGSNVGNGNGVEFVRVS